MTVRELSRFMADTIPNLTEVQARHYLEGRVPRDQYLRDIIIDTLGLNRAYIEGWDSAPEGELLSGVQLSYNSRVLSGDYRSAQEFVGRSALYILDTFRSVNILLDMFYTSGKWSFVTDESSGLKHIVHLKPRDYITFSLHEAQATDLGSSSKIFFATLTRETLTHTIETIRNARSPHR